jgi:hypothetical protein
MRSAWPLVETSWTCWPALRSASRPRVKRVWRILWPVGSALGACDADEHLRLFVDRQGLLRRRRGLVGGLVALLLRGARRPGLERQRILFHLLQLAERAREEPCGRQSCGAPLGRTGDRVNGSVPGTARIGGRNNRSAEADPTRVNVTGKTRAGRRRGAEGPVGSDRRRRG